MRRPASTTKTTLIMNVPKAKATIGPILSSFVNQPGSAAGVVASLSRACFRAANAASARPRTISTT